MSTSVPNHYVHGFPPFGLKELRKLVTLLKITLTDMKRGEKVPNNLRRSPEPSLFP